MDILYVSHVAILLVAPLLSAGVAYWAYANREHDSLPSFLFLLMIACWGVMSVGEMFAPAIGQNTR